LRERKEKSETLSQSLIVRMTQRAGGEGERDKGGQFSGGARARARESSFLSLKEISMSSRHYASQGRGGGGGGRPVFCAPAPTMARRYAPALGECLGGAVSSL